MSKQRQIAARLNLKKTDLVLEIGSGNYPFYRSDVLIDKFPMVTASHRTTMRAVRLDDRPFLVADAHALPFVNTAFDCIICRHVLEHLPRPEDFAAEIKRVGRRGYIATPSPFTELVHGGYYKGIGRLNETQREVLHHGKGEAGHKWFVIGLDNHLYLTAKEEEIYELYTMFGTFVKKNTDYERNRFFRRNEGWRETELYWQSEKLRITILRDIPVEDKVDESLDLDELIETCKTLSAIEPATDLKSRIKSSLNGKREFDLESLLACPVCKKPLQRKTDRHICNDCGEYPHVAGIPLLIREALNLVTA